MTKIVNRNSHNKNDSDEDDIILYTLGKEKCINYWTNNLLLDSNHHYNLIDVTLIFKVFYKLWKARGTKPALCIEFWGSSFLSRKTFLRCLRPLETSPLTFNRWMRNGTDTPDLSWLLNLLLSTFCQFYFFAPLPLHFPLLLCLSVFSFASVKVNQGRAVMFRVCGSCDLDCVHARARQCIK